MKKERIDFHLNCIKMCQSDKALIKRIEEIFADGNENGWKEAGQCPKCLKDLKEEIRYCKECAKDNNEVQNENN